MQTETLMRATLIALGLTLTASPALAAASGQSMEPIQVAPIRDGRLATTEQWVQVPTTDFTCDGRAIQTLYADDLAVDIT
ncbi:hypothetical protein CVH10_21740, partial [Halomonas sp. ND22Bw]